MPCCGQQSTGPLAGAPGVSALPASAPSLVALGAVPGAPAQTGPVTSCRFPWGWFLIGVLLGMVLQRRSRA
jgi:hypothetical protein